jgi:putative transposase
MGGLPQRRHPSRGVHVSLSEPTIVFVTVCTRNREPWVAQPAIHAALVHAWREADAWLVGRYVLMPDHVHLFCAPGNLDYSLHDWTTYWKRIFTRTGVAGSGRWQRDCWDTRLRQHEHYSEKWEYVRRNPVRKGLVSDPDDWPFQGEIHVLRW